MDERLPKIFGRRFAATLPACDVARGAIVSDNLWVIDGNVSRALVEISQGIAARCHDFTDQPIGLGDSLLWSVHEASLEFAPGLREPRGVGGAESPNLQTLDPLGAGLQRRFRATHVANIMDCPFVLGTEPCPQPPATTCLHDEPQASSHHDR